MNLFTFPEKCPEIESNSLTLASDFHWNRVLCVYPHGFALEILNILFYERSKSGFGDLNCILPKDLNKQDHKLLQLTIMDLKLQNSRKERESFCIPLKFSLP